MQSILSLSLFLLLPGFLFCQEYVPIISTTDSSDTWLEENSCTDFSCYFTSTHRYTVQGDTLIDGQSYAKFYKLTKYETGPAPSEWCSETVTYYDEEYFGAVRESGNKVLMVPNYSTDGTAFVAYDFTLTVGDTLPSPTGFPESDFPLVISTIDSVMVFGAYRKRFVVDSYRYVIEGIGASTGLFNPIAIGSNCSNQLLCYLEHSVPDYFDSDCEINLSVDAYPVNQPPAHLVKIVDVLGRETTYQPNKLLIYIYSDGGSTEKGVKVE